MNAPSRSEKPMQTSQTSPDGTFLMTPAQHRRSAALLRETDPAMTLEEKQRAAKLASHHEALARAIEKRTLAAAANINS
jgi:hypothetical protein